MFEKYERFLKDFDEILHLLFKTQEEYIKCKPGCSRCCEKGNYPFSQLEFSYMTQGYINLPGNTKILVQQNLRNLIAEKNEFNGEIFEHRCPFLLNSKCTIYPYRGLVCRTFGIAYYDDTAGCVKLPECTEYGKNYSEYYDKKNKTLKIKNVPRVNLRTDRILSSELFNKYNLDFGEIRPLLQWIEKQK